jgi:hypothetical protein
VDSIAELDLLWSIGVSVAAGHTVACQTQATDCTLNLGRRCCTPASEGDQRVIYNSFVGSDMDSASAVRSIGIESV